MACHGSKVLQSGRRREAGSDDDVHRRTRTRGGKKGKHGKGERRERDQQGRRASSGGTSRQNLSFRNPEAQSQEITDLRKKVDSDTVKYFSEIGSLLEGSEMDFEQISAICSNALEETRGKELQLASDKILSRVVERLLENSSLGELCGFLRSCAPHFPDIAVDQAGSHVAETALKSLSNFLHDEDCYSAVEHTLAKVCQEVAAVSGRIMLSSYGSHVFRSLLCVCKGTKLDDSEKIHVLKRTSSLAERLSVKSVRLAGNYLTQDRQGFPELFKCLIGGILGYARDNIADLQVSSYSSLVLQTMLKLLAGDDQELFNVIPILLGCNHSSAAKDEEYLETAKIHEILVLLKDTAFSHLMEVILEVAPDTLYNEIFLRVFRGSLFEISSHNSSNFVSQALLSSVRHEDQVSLIWEELGSHFKDLFKMRKSGVVASLLAACRRLHTHEKQCSRALVGAVLSESESPSCIVPRIIFLENYFSSEEMTSWSWPRGMKISVLGCLILQTIFSYPSKYIQPFVSSMIALEAGLVLQVAKDASGGHILESFISSNVSVKRKYKLIAKLEGHFGELALLSSGSFTVEKCFTCGSLSLKELIVSELSSVQIALSRTKHGPHVLKKLDVPSSSWYIEGLPMLHVLSSLLSCFNLLWWDLLI
ncbi:pumilio homolog 23 isoform X2 [Nymphaea colorata]|uniref:pumilio homolog 23 isoform X2 n=1 Tax=Nymphaea colorata TaxID=210225 RepID=UPI00214F52B2|nr:pumilio homolog 23 isoform X2 [Nymphaea colorata]